MNAPDFSIIGCRVSIISKAKIRYEGNLHSIDFDTPNEPVITLSKVWSFGTEDRQCERPVAPRNEEYNQVVFRGRDLDDVRVVQSSVFLNEDSAIVSAAPGSALSHPPGMPPHEGRVVQVPSVGSRPGPVGTVHSDHPQTSDGRGPRPFGDGRSDIDPGIFSAFGRTNVAGQGLPESGTGAGRRSIIGSGHEYSHSWVNHDHGIRKVDMYRNSSNYNQVHDYSRNRPVGYTQQWSNHRGSRGTSHSYNGWSGRLGGGHEWSKFRTGVPATVGETTNFSGEYDYERANAELAAELEKICISSVEGRFIQCFCRQHENDGSSATGDENACYDKSKSFFDTISSEMMDRANGVNPQGMNRRDERLLNSATFGAIPQQYPRRMSYNQRSFGYGQRRGGNASSGNFWRSNGSGNKHAFTNSPHTPLPTSERAG
ncbi:unnamed protein product [Heterobilharzia americana]|nr:unnamed protein product [Heterobilharzia americana]